jgi:hypothetical protein
VNQVPKLVEHENIFIAASHGRCWLCNKLWILDLAAVGAGEPAEILLGISNNGDEALKVVFIQASLNLPYDHRIHVQNFTVQEFGNTIVPTGIQASFPYTFTVNKYLQVRLYILLVGIKAYASGYSSLFGAQFITTHLQHAAQYEVNR